MKYLLLAGLIVIIYRYINVPALPKKKENDPVDFTDYEEIE
jgi:hypothetical protein